MAARYGGGATARGRKITGDDLPLYAHPEEIGKGLSQARAVYHGMSTSERRIVQAHAAGAVGAAAAMPFGYRQGKKDGRAGGVGAARALTRGALLPGYNYGRLAAVRERKAKVGKGLVSMDSLKQGAKVAGFNAKVAGTLAAPKVKQAARAATATPGRKALTAAAGGALGGAALTRGQQPQPLYVAPYSQGFGKAYRRYDPERNRQRRAGAAEATLAIGGGYAAHRGVRGIQRDTKELREDKVRRGVGPGKKLGGGVIEQTVGSKYGRRAIAVSRRNGLLVGGGLAGIAAAGGVGHWQNSNRGRTYR